MADDKKLVSAPLNWDNLQRIQYYVYDYDENTRELRLGDRVIGYADLAGRFQIEPEYEEYVRNNPPPWHKRSSDEHKGSASSLGGSLLNYLERYGPGLYGETGIVPPMDKKTLQSQHASVMIGNRAGLMDLATNKVYDRISMKELGEVDAKGVLQLNQTTSKLPEYEELRGKPVRQQVPPNTNVRLRFHGMGPAGEALREDKPAYWDTETGEIRERKEGGVVYGKMMRDPYDRLNDNIYPPFPPDSPYGWAHKIQVVRAAGPNDARGPDGNFGPEAASETSIQPKDPTMGKHPGEFDPALIDPSKTVPVKPAPPASPDRKGSNAQTKKKSLLQGDLDPK